MMENKKFDTGNLLLKMIAILLIGIGMGTPGLWPYQLPCCILGGMLLGIS